MRSVIAGLVVSLGLSGFAWAQEGKEKGKDGKKEPSLSLKDVDTNGDGRASVTEIKIAIAKLTNTKDGQNKEKRKDGDGGKERKEGKGVQEPSILLKDLDTNSDGRATVAELQAALDSLTNKKDGEKKEGGDKKK